MRYTPELMAAAKYRYENAENRVKPSWDQLGEVTKQVWCRMVENEDPNWPFKYSVLLGKAETAPVTNLEKHAEENFSVSSTDATLAAALQAIDQLPPRPLTLKEKLALKGLK